MPAALKPPIILLGNTRSGTSMVQNVLSEHDGLVAWYEPRNLWQYADPGRPHDEFYAQDATDRVVRYIRRKFLRYQRHHGDRVVVEKTPVNILRIPYVRAIFPDATLVFIVRDPFSFISSVELKWQRTVSAAGAGRRLRSTPPSQLHHYAAKYARQLLDKHVLRRTYLSVWGPRYREIAEDLNHEDLLTVIARQWAVCSMRAEEAMAAMEPGSILRLRYEDFVQDPLPHLERIADHCGLQVTASMVEAATTRVDRGRQEKWRRMDPRALASVLPELESEMQRHGYEVPAEIAAARDGIEPDPVALRETPGHGTTAAFGHPQEVV